MRGRYVKENRTTRTPGVHLAISVETDDVPAVAGGGVRMRPRRAALVYWRCEGGVARGRKVYEFDSMLHFRQAVGDCVSRQRQTWLWSANLGREMTLAGLWNWIDTGDFSLRSPAQAKADALVDPEKKERKNRGYLCLGDPPTIISGWMDGKRLVLLDVRNWWRDGVPVTGVCQRDVEAVESAAVAACDLVRKLDLGVMQKTLAGQAFQHWRHLAGRPSVLIPDQKKVSRLERAAYYGGRSAAFWVGPMAGPIYHLDVNSIYAYVMMRYSQPRKLLEHIDHARMSDLGSVAAVQDCAATVQLETSAPYPVRPTSGPVLYATGRYWTHLCGADLARAVSDGVVSKVGRVSRYALGPVCAAFAEFWTDQRAAMRQSGEKHLENLAKLMPCALYGRWAAKRHGWESVDIPLDGQRWGGHNFRAWDTGVTHPGRVIAGELEVDFSHELNVVPIRQPIHLDGRKLPDRDVETENSFPAISAWITAAARAHMDALRAAAGPETVYYQCVDSIHVSEAGFYRLASAGLTGRYEPGLLKQVAVYEHVIYHGVNCYVADGQLVAAGIPASIGAGPDGQERCRTYEGLASILDRGPDGTVRVATMDRPKPKNPWGQYDQIGSWQQPVKLGGD